MKTLILSDSKDMKHTATQDEAGLIKVTFETDPGNNFSKKTAMYFTPGDIKELYNFVLEAENE